MAMELVFLVTIIASLGALFFVGRAEQGIKFGQGINRRFGQRRTIMAQELLRPLQARFQPES